MRVKCRIRWFLDPKEAKVEQTKDAFVSVCMSDRRLTAVVFELITRISRPGKPPCQAGCRSKDNQCLARCAISGRSGADFVRRLSLGESHWYLVFAVEA